MARVFNDWYLGLDGEEQRAWHNEQDARDDAARALWEAENGHPAQTVEVPVFGMRLSKEQIAELPAIDDDIPFA